MISVTALQGLAHNPKVALKDQALLQQALRSGSGGNNWLDLTTKQQAAFDRAVKRSNS